MEISEIVPNEIWDIVWQTFANASLTYDLVSSQNGTKGNNDDGNFSFDNPAKLGILTGFFIACLADYKIATPKFQLDVCLDLKFKTIALGLLNITIFLFLAPPISLILTIFFIYRKIVELTLRISLKKEFAGLLEGTDCVWALEESTALSVINVLAILEKNDEKSNDDFMEDFRDLIKNRLSTSNFEKLNYLREKKYGYYYWRKSEEISIDERVRWMQENHEKCDGTCDDINGNFLKNILTELTNKILPKNHSTSWEILIGKTCSKSSSIRLIEKIEEGLVKFEEKNIKNRSTIPILFRIHHCLGDGVALLRLLLESIADSKIPKIDETSRCRIMEKKIRIPILRENSKILGIVKNEKEIIYNEKDLLIASMPFTTRIPLCKIVKSIFSQIDDSSKILKNLIVIDLRETILRMLENAWNNFGAKIVKIGQKRINEILKILKIVIFIPNCLLQQAFRSMDNSALHGPILNGQKILSCWMEADMENLRIPNLLDKIRDIKNATGSRFGDVVLAALSENLCRYYYKIGEPAPKNMTVVIPARMTIPSQKLSLQNDFSVGLLTLCCSEVNGEYFTKDVPVERRLFERLNDVARSSEKLRNEPDYVINFWVMKWLSAALPEYILRPILESHSTFVFSNLPGPQEVSIIGKKLKNVAFWIPHRGNTGLGCSLLTFGGKVHISLVADSAIIPCQKDLDEILVKSIEDIEKLYDSISLSCLTMKF